MPIHQAMFAALKEIKGERNMTMSALGNIGKKLFSNQEGSGKSALKQLSGPVGIVRSGAIILQKDGFITFLGL